MMNVLIDADIVPYEIGSVMEKDGVRDWQVVKAGVDNRIKGILSSVQERYLMAPARSLLYLSDPEGVWRKKVAFILPYKGNRKSEKPYHWDGIRAYLREELGAMSYPGLEGDDALLIERASFLRDLQEVVIASTDKDLRQTPGVYFSWGRGDIPPRWDAITSRRAQENFWTQMLVGDRGDNILGLFGVGEASAAVKTLYTLPREVDMADHVAHEYTRRFGTYWWDFFSEHFSLLKILEEPEDVNNPYFAWMKYLIRSLGVFDNNGVLEWVESKNSMAGRRPTPGEYGPSTAENSTSSISLQD